MTSPTGVLHKPEQTVCSMASLIDTSMASLVEASKTNNSSLDLSSLSGQSSHAMQTKLSSDNRDLLSKLLNVLDITSWGYSSAVADGESSLARGVVVAKPTHDASQDDKKLIDRAFTSVKYKMMAGVRLEARGRLTKRLTASRSVFKLK